RRATIAVRASMRAHDRLTASGLGLLGAIILAGTTYAADQIDREWVTSRVDQLSFSAPERWQPVLAELSGYPLCGNARCRNLVCRELYGMNTWEAFSRLSRDQQSVLTAYLGAPPSERCILLP